MTDTEHRVALTIARGILYGFRIYYSGFKDIMGRSKRRFEERDWAGLQGDADERLVLYQRAIERTAEYVTDMLGERSRSPEVWREVQDAYAVESEDPANGDLARAYFSTVKRRFIAVDASDYTNAFTEVEHPEQFVEEVRVIETSREPGAIELMLRRVLELFPFETPYVDLDEDIRQAAAFLEDRLGEGLGRRPVAMLKPIFYRARRAHLIGRVWSAGRYVPLVIAIINAPDGLRLGEVLLGHEETSSLFSFTRSHFHVVTAHHRELMGFLRSLAPGKSPADLYASVGYNNLSKSALLADMYRNLKKGRHRFRRTSGVSGTVMLAFELPEFRFVLKMIRDRFLPRRVDTTRDKVARRYRFVQYAERLGRILDIFHFQHVAFEREWFEESLIEEIATSAPSLIQVDGPRVILNEFYAQRRVEPLDMFYRSGVDPAILRRVVIDFGFLHKELASRNIFTGDVVPNNFGVVSVGKRNMRVVSFDYDGYSRVTEMNFLGAPSTVDTGSTPGFSHSHDPTSVYDDWNAPEESMVIDEEWDILPEKFRITFGIPEAFREEFDRVHGELYTPGYWVGLQKELAKRPEVIDGFPYRMLGR